MFVPTLVLPVRNFCDRPTAVDPFSTTRPTSKSPHAKAMKTMNALAVLILGLQATTTAFLTSAGPHSRSTTAAGVHGAKAAISTSRVDTSRMLASTGTGFFESLFGGQKASPDDISLFGH